ncbi:protein ABHD15-like isoform X2 [Lineus longissimus]|uniref:protein ABHD15-like isoform X2 n=1 Tax=Lineus longissimus TaxID=88925 RepID=UPI002B4ECAB0
MLGEKDVADVITQCVDEEMLTVSWVEWLPRFFVAGIMLFLMLLILGYLIDSFICHKEEPPTLCYRNSLLSKYLLKKCERLRQPYHPNVFLRNRHIQTLLSLVIRPIHCRFDRTYLQMKDKGVIALDWFIGERNRDIAACLNIILIIPRILGNALSVHGACTEASNLGYSAVVFNRRGQGGSELTTPLVKPYSDHTDLGQVVAYLKDMFPNATITAISYGLGSGCLLSYLGEYGSSAKITTAVCISPVYDAKEVLRSGIRKPYSWLLLWRLKQILRRHASAFERVLDVQNVCQSNDLLEYDYRISECNGYSNFDSYWEENNPFRDVDDIATPMLFINSLDDPVCTKDTIAFDLFKAYPNFILCLTKYGGHCGFLENMFQTTSTWAESLAIQYIRASLNFIWHEKRINLHLNNHRR